MRIYVAHHRTVQHNGARLHFAPGWYDVDEAFAGAMVRDELAETVDQVKEREQKGAAAPGPTEGVMHAARSKATSSEPVDPGPGVMHPPTRKGDPLPAATAPEGKMHPPTTKPRLNAPVDPTPETIAAAAAPAVHTGDDDATGIKEPTLDAGEEFNQGAAVDDVQTSAQEND